MNQMTEPQALLRAMFDAALAAADPLQMVAPNLPEPPAGRTIVLGAGKAAARMAQAVEAAWSGPLEGLVITRYGHAVPCQHIEVVEASHPVPDEAGETATLRILELAASATKNDLVIFLISGGGSALLTAPMPGLTLADKQAVNAQMLASGANISEMNCLRKHLSRVKGGRLALAAGEARQVTLMISDVPGDDPATIASGPTVPDPTTAAEALEIVRRYRIDLPESIIKLLEQGSDETPKPDHPAFKNTEIRMIATPQMALEAAAEAARQHVVTPLILSDRIEGEAREVAKVMAGMARQVGTHGQPAPPPCVLLSGGETTVTVRNKGRGGRNVEFLLALAVELHGAPGVHALAADTDGVDGKEEIAGALIGPDTLERALGMGLSPRAMLDGNDAHSFFEALEDQVITGPTLTNVNDFRAILIEPAKD